MQRHIKRYSQAKELTRFYKKVNLGTSALGFSVLLDGRPLKTPSGTVVNIPIKYQALALLTCAEWEGQDKILKSYSLPMTSIMVRSLDSLSCPETRQGVIDNVLNYVDTDSVW